MSTKLNITTKDVSPIMGHISGQWTLEQRHESYVVAKRSDGLAIGFYKPTYPSKNRVEVSPCVPKNSAGRAMILSDWGVINYREAAPSCTFDASRPAKIVAGQIVRTVIAPYEPLYLKVLERQKADNERYETTKKTVAKLAALLGEDVTLKPGETQARIHIGDGLEKIYGHITISGPDCIEIELRYMDEDAARRVLRAALKGKA